MVGRTTSYLRIYAALEIEILYIEAFTKTQLISSIIPFTPHNILHPCANLSCVQF